MEDNNKITRNITFNPIFIGFGYSNMIYNQEINGVKVGRLRVRLWYLPFCIISVTDTNVPYQELNP